jgi:hypothetical protein
MKRLDKQAEDKLLGAIENTAVLVSDGMDPCEAIAKSAQDCGVPPGHINLMVHAYNTGRTTRQREDGTDTLSKAANFPLAETDKVLAILYPQEVKTAASQHHATAVSTEYYGSPGPLLARRSRAERRKQAANIDWRRWAADETYHADGSTTLTEFTVTTPSPYTQEPREALKQAYCHASQLQHEINEARRKESAAMDKIANLYGDLTECLQRPDCPPLHVVREQAGYLYGKYGHKLVDDVVAITPSIAKMAHHKARPTTTKVSNYRLVAADGEVFGLISEILDNLEDYNRLKQAHEDLRRSHLRQAEETIRPFAERPVSVLEELGYSTPTTKEGMSLMPTLLGVSAVKNLMTPSSDAKKDQSNKALSSLVDPAHEAQLRNIRTQATLQDLMANDPVIHGYDPTETIDAFNEIVSTAPRTADQRLVIQSLLRKRLAQGALDPFEVEQLLSMEEKQRKINSPQAAGGGDGSVLA